MTKTIDLKGSNFILSVLQLSTSNFKEIESFIKDKKSQAPAFFEHAPLTIDIDGLDRQDIDYLRLKKVLASNGFVPVGILGAKTEETQTLIKQAGFAVMSNVKSDKYGYQEEKPKPILKVIDQAQPAKIITTPVRSGQQIYAKDCDLVILKHVSHGAEVIADGNIHIYGALHGRAIAGASCKQEAQIFCQNLQAELVSINGDYWLNDNIPEEFKNKNARIWRQDNQLMISTLNN